MCCYLKTGKNLINLKIKGDYYYGTIMQEINKRRLIMLTFNDCKEEAGFFAGKIIYKNGETDDSDLHPVDMADDNDE